MSIVVKEESYPIWKNVTSKYRSHYVYTVEEEPEALHIIQLGYQDTYAVFYEDAYEIEPWQTGLMVMNAQQISDKFNIKL